MSGWGSGANAPLYGVGITLLAVMAICALIGFIIETCAYRPLRNSPRLNVLITAIGVSLLLENLGQLPWAFGSQPASMPQLLAERVLANVAGVNLRLVDVAILMVTVVLMIGLEWLVFHSRMGRAMRAVSYSPATAALMGINVNRVISITFVLGSALAGAAGFFNALKYPSLQQPAHSQWILLGLKAFVAAVVGGIGNVHGAVLGGVLIGMVEMFGAGYLSPHLRDVYVFSLLIVVLLLRPTGLLGRADLEKM
jgi:branched-chain amino acid transport system permease protein